MAKKVIKLTESDLHRIVANVVNTITEGQDFMDIRYDSKCPNCGEDLYDYIWNPKNIESASGRYDYYDVDGFQLYRNANYTCPNCGKRFHTRVRSNNDIFDRMRRK
jgi:predicted RNA-binding Zn-ribbon protein involved in translation (DUF1610 family)